MSYHRDVIGGNKMLNKGIRLSWYCCTVKIDKEIWLVNIFPWGYRTQVWQYREPNDFFQHPHALPDLIEINRQMEKMRTNYTSYCLPKHNHNSNIIVEPTLENWTSETREGSRMVTSSIANIILLCLTGIWETGKTVSESLRGTCKNCLCRSSFSQGSERIAHTWSLSENDSHSTSSSLPMMQNSSTRTGMTNLKGEVA